MNIKKLAGPVAATAIAFGIAAATVIPASAIDNIKPFGKQAILNFGSNGIGYTVMGLSPSADVVPYPVGGRLFESTVTVDALWGSVIPMIPMFNARAESGANYRVLADVSSLSGAPLPPGASSTGKLYFDVVGDVPNSVVYNDGDHDILGWVGPTPTPPTFPGSSTGGGGQPSGEATPPGGSSGTGPNATAPPESGNAGGNAGGAAGPTGAGGGNAGGAAGPGGAGGGGAGGAAGPTGAGGVGGMGVLP